MAEDKSFAPSAKRLEDARKKGDVPVAAEMRHAVMLTATAGGALLLGERSIRQLATICATLWGAAGDWRLDEHSAHGAATGMARAFAAAVVPLLGLLLLAAAALVFVQGRPTLTWSRVAPQWRKLNPAAGIKRQFGTRGLLEFSKTVLKCCCILVLGLWVLRPHWTGLEQTVGMAPAAVLATIAQLAWVLLKTVLAATGVLAGADFLYQHRSFLKRMRMSLQELRDEHKESDGDPTVKSRQRQIGMSRVRQRMMSAVPSASVIVTNPTHYAVALRYDHGAMRAPFVVAKGTDLIALRIREIAAEHAVPVVESPPLARALYAGADLDRPIPVEHYAAVAEIISYVLKLSATKSGHQR